MCVAASCTRNNKAVKKFFSAPSAQKVKNFLRASREKEISFLEGGESLEVLVIFFAIFDRTDLRIGAFGATFHKEIDFDV